MRIKVVAGGLSALALSVTQAATGQPALQLGDSVITGTGFEVAALMSPGSITRIGEDELRRKSLADVSELFRDIPGVVLADADTPGMKRISIRGESSRRVVIRIDGQTMTDHSTYGTPLLIDPAMIERVEVVRGPSSVINGANAVGGVVNIITKRGADVPLQTYVGGGYYSATQGYRSNAGLAGSSGDFDYRLSLSRSEHGDRRTRGFGELDNSAYDSESAMLHLGYTLGQHYVALKAERFNLTAGSWVEPKPNQQLSLSFPKRDQTRYAVFYEGKELSPVLKKLSANAYIRKVDREFTNSVQTVVPPAQIRNESLDDQDTRGIAAQAELELWADQTTLIGVEYMDDRLDSDKLTNSIITTPMGVVRAQRTSRQKASQQTASAFAQQRWEFAENWTAFLGGRYYRVESELERSTERAGIDGRDERVLGSLGLVYSPEPNWALRANLSQGYSYPNLTQLYSVTTASDRIHYGNPDLKAERARVMELGWRYEVPRVTTDVALFHTVSKDYIDRERVTATPDGYQPPAPSRNPLEQWQYVNVSKAHTTGIEASLELRPDWLVQPHGAISLSRRKFDYGNGYSTWNSGLPSTMGTVGLRHYPQIWQQLDTEVDLFVRAASGSTHKGADRKVEDRESGYATLNFAMNFDYQERLSAKVLLGNLLNRSYQPIDELPGLKRHIDTEITLTF